MNTRLRSIGIVTLGLLLAVGCGSDEPLPPNQHTAEPPAAQLVSVQDEPRGAHCPGGGAAIREGADANRNGLLDPAEVSATRYVCTAPGQLTQLAQEPSGANCPHGGTAVLTGADLDADGALGAAEVTERKYVCEAAGPLTLSRIESEASGAHCAAGGKAVRSGPDRDGDGVLDAEEVARTDYVCDVRELTRVDVEPAGSRCIGGGAAVHTGTDVSADGVLQDAEVQATRFVCDRVVTGNASVRTQADLDALAQIEVITGDLHFFNSQLETVTLPALRVIGGGLTVFEGDVWGEPPLLRTLALPALEQLGRGLFVEDSVLQRLSLPSLLFMPRDIQLSGAQLARVDLDELRSARSLQLSGLPALALLHAPRLSSTGALRVVGSALPVLSLPQLSQVESLTLQDSALSELRLPLLQFVSDSLRIEELPALQTVDLAWLRTVGGYTHLFRLPMLETLTLTELEQVRSLDVSQNGALATFTAPQLQKVEGHLGFDNLPALTRLELPWLWSVEGQLTLTDLPALTTPPALGSLRTVREYFFVARTGLPRLAAPQLERVGHLYIGTQGSPTPALTTLDLPSLASVGGLALYELPNLASLGVPALRLITQVAWDDLQTNGIQWGMHVAGAARLPRCSLDALLAQLAFRPSKVTITAVDEAATCAP